MKSRPEFDDPWEAARVSTFMEPAIVGRWEIRQFSISEEHTKLHYARTLIESDPERRKMRQARLIPPGEYLMLARKATESEIKDMREGRFDDPGPDQDYTPVMSDTPSEIREHAAAIEGAHGDVLITGLGLGCIVSALLAKPEVKSITVIEVDRDVIALTGPYYEDEPRVQILNYDALGFVKYLDSIQSGVVYDYAWHDIWSHIADRNLNDDRIAEHGISYRTMFEAYEPYTDVQDAWAYFEALAMEQAASRERARVTAWGLEFVGSNHERQAVMLEDFLIRQHLPTLPWDEDVPDHVRTFFRETLQIHEAVAKMLAMRDMAADIKATIEEPESMDPMARPNEAPDANVATR